jgi:NRPS condensation-like uncharacterized protein
MIEYEGPATSGQRLLWFMDHYRGGAGALNCPVVLRLRGSLDRSALQSALDAITARHESLRTTFRGRGRRLTQVVHTPQPVVVSTVDLGDDGVDDSLFRLNLNAELKTRIDPEHWPVRVTLWRLGANDRVLCFNMHHLVTDGHSCGIFVRELHQQYDRALGRACDLPPVGWQHARFAEWEAELLRNRNYARHLDYWQGQLANARILALPFAQLPSDQAGWRGETKALDMDGPMVERMRSVARTYRTTPFTVMLAAYYAVLYRLTQETDISIGSVFLNRPFQEVQNTIGFFANLLVLRTRVPNRSSFAGLLRHSHGTVMDAFMHQALSYHMLPANIMQVGALRPDEVVFQMMTQPIGSSRMGDVDVEALLTDGVGNRFEFELAVLTTDRGLSTVVSYNRARVEPDWAESFLAQYVRTIALAVDRPDLLLAELD